MNTQVRVRFAPSPTGGLHIGGVRTVLFNYLFAKKHKGTFVLRIEDTDQTRFVEGAEAYIFNCLAWCGLEPDESVLKPGEHAPYRQSERKAIYWQYAQQLIQDGHAYYAFDTPEELEKMREQYKSEQNPTPQYNHSLRKHMRNSLTMSEQEVAAALANHTPFVVRLKVPENRILALQDMIRGEVTFDTNLVDDKVLLKADGMPTYHLAVVVDDYLMKISHAFRGEEWLPSAPIHLLLWEFLGWKNAMPQWAHLPLILKPDGHGKLSKRDGDRLGFPVFAMNWEDPKTKELNKGFKEIGFLPEAFINMLALLGWNDGSGQEIFTLDELIQQFDISRVHKGGAKFDFEKAKWFNHQYIQKLEPSALLAAVTPFLPHAFQAESALMERVLPLIKDRLTLLSDIWEQSHFFFTHPEQIDTEAIRSKWDEAKQTFYVSLIHAFEQMSIWDEPSIEATFNEVVANQGIKKGEVMLPFRIMLVGGKFGPGVFAIAELIKKEHCIKRIQFAMQQL
jgi:glutamyl-tRNA synthetase